MKSLRNPLNPTPVARVLAPKMKEAKKNITLSSLSFLSNIFGKSHRACNFNRRTRRRRTTTTNNSSSKIVILDLGSSWFSSSSKSTIVDEGYCVNYGYHVRNTSPPHLDYDEKPLGPGFSSITHRRSGVYQINNRIRRPDAVHRVQGHEEEYEHGSARVTECVAYAMGN